MRAEGSSMTRFDIDAVLCISLEDRTDRRELLEKSFQALNHDIEYVLIQRDSEDPERGCYQSHLKCAQLALERGYQRVLILEDDATFLPPSPRQLKWINRFLRWRNPQLFHLGGILGRMWLIPFPFVVRARMTGAHAYILSHKACQRLVKTSYQGIAIDSLFCRFFRAYSTFPMIAYQQPEAKASSDIMAHRALTKNLEIKDEAYWANNEAKQWPALRRNWIRTLCLRFF